MNNEVYQRLKALKPKLEKDYHLKRLRLFGSHARDDFTEDSDVDLIVEFSDMREKTYFTIFDMIYEIEDALEKKVDFVFEHKIYPALKDSILEDAIDV